MVSDGSPVTVTATWPPIWIVFVLLVELGLGVPDGGRVVVLGLVLVDVGVELEEGVDDGAAVCWARAAARLSAQVLRGESAPHTTTSKVVVSASRKRRFFGVTTNPANREFRSRSTLAMYTPC